MRRSPRSASKLRSAGARQFRQSGSFRDRLSRRHARKVCRMHGYRCKCVCISIRPCIKFSQIALSQTAAQQLRFPHLRFVRNYTFRICSDFKLQYLNGQAHEIADPPTLRFLEYRFLRLLLLMRAAPELLRRCKHAMVQVPNEKVSTSCSRPNKS